MAGHPLDCRSPEGVTVGLVDSIITAARVLRGRDLDHPAVREALADLAEDEDVARLMSASRE
ncbi:hypothetical protein [Actinomadura meridiana]|uniref:hypothetical protein n=1 Tax=Actinomadura meridiana TaxID=559626 RepID=UPI0031E5C433